MLSTNENRCHALTAAVGELQQFRRCDGGKGRGVGGVGRRGTQQRASAKADRGAVQIDAKRIHAAKPVNGGRLEAQIVRGAHRKAGQALREGGHGAGSALNRGVLATLHDNVSGAKRIAGDGGSPARQRPVGAIAVTDAGACDRGRFESRIGKNRNGESGERHVAKKTDRRCCQQHRPQTERGDSYIHRRAPQAKG